MHTLNLSRNYLESYSDLEHLIYLKELSVVDVSNNMIEDPTVVDIFGAMENLKVLSLMGNPVIRKISAYRKTVTLRCVRYFARTPASIPNDYFSYRNYCRTWTTDRSSRGIGLVRKPGNEVGSRRKRPRGNDGYNENTRK